MDPYSSPFTSPIFVSITTSLIPCEAPGKLPNTTLLGWQPLDSISKLFVLPRGPAEALAAWGHRILHGFAFNCATPFFSLSICLSIHVSILYSYYTSIPNAEGPSPQRSPTRLGPCTRLNLPPKRRSNQSEGACPNSEL